jgi:hypothetical protein
MNFAFKYAEMGETCNRHREIEMRVAIVGGKIKVEIKAGKYL